MFAVYEGRSIICVTDARPEGSYIEIADDTNIEGLLSNYQVIEGALVPKTGRCPSTLKVAMITSYGINCGIATYSKQLCDAMRPLVKELRIFAEDVSFEMSDGNDNVVRCWSREAEDFSEVVPKMEEYDPDVIYIQHEYGCFGNALKWNALVGHLSARWRVVVVLHSVYDQDDKLVFEAPCQEIITHTKSGRELLKARGVDHCPIHYIPHGCRTAEPLETKFSKMPSQVVFQYGFGFEYKGWSNVIDIMDAMPEGRYVGVFNISKFSETFSTRYYAKLMQEIAARGLSDRVVLHKGFRSEKILLSYMQQSQVNLFPYWNHPEWRVHGASGAIRLALASGTPTVVGNVPFFDELRGYVPVCDTIDEYVGEIRKLFASPEYRAEVSAGAARFIAERTWDKCAAWYLECLNSPEFTAETCPSEPTL